LVASSKSVGVKQTLVSGLHVHFRLLVVLVGRSVVGTHTGGFLSAFFVTQTGSFDFLSLHVKAQVTGTSDKELVKVGAVVVGLLVLDSIKSINVELSLEGSVFCLVKVLGHDGVGKFLGLVDLKCLAGWKPGNDRLLSRCFRVFKNGMELEREGKLREHIVGVFRACRIIANSSRDFFVDVAAGVEGGLSGNSLVLRHLKVN